MLPRKLLSSLLMLIAPLALADTLAQRDIVFYYGSRPPVEDLRHFDQIVIQPSQILPHEKTALLNLDASVVFAYISYGEVARNSEDMPRIKTKWSIGVNPAWDSLVMDMTDPAWHEYLLEHHFGRLWRDGYRAFFLDTVDSYLIVTSEGKEREKQEKGLVALLEEVKVRFPGCKLILNRGFEVLDRAAPLIDGMVAESLFHGFDPVTGKHAPTREENRGWLLTQLRRAQDEFGVPITVLDYVEPGDWDEAERTARRIVELGFMPWVANGDLTWLGQGRIRLAPRRLLALVNGTPSGQMEQALFRHAAMPLEYHGLALDYWYVDQLPLPIEPLVGRYAGVVAWLPEDEHGRYGSLCARLKPEVEAGLPVVFLGHLPPGAACQDLIGYRGELQSVAGALDLVSADTRLGRPSSIPVVGSGTPAIRVDGERNAWLALGNGEQTFHPVAVGAWGGYALHPHVMRETASGRHRWLLDPFAFFAAALRLPAHQPVFDMTTENGRRLGIVEVRGDRLFPVDGQETEVAGRLAAWMERNRAPVTLGVIEAEAGSDAQREAVRQLAALPHVRLASHTYSHPFYWGIFEGKPDAERQPYRYGVFIDGYAAEMARETTGTMGFIRALAAGSPPLLIWPGDGNPGAAVLATIGKEALPHYGGGGLHWQSGPLSLADLSPALRPTPWGTQVLTPLVGEPLFAQLWYGEALNFGIVREWNRELDAPRRLRAASLSFHADALMHPGGPALLDELARVQREEGVLGVWLDEYVARARAFQTASLARELGGRWLVAGDALRTLRLPASEPPPRVSADVVGHVERGEVRYVHLARNRAVLEPAAEGRPAPRLIDADAPLKSWHLNSDGSATFLFDSRGELALTVPASCTLKVNGEVHPARARDAEATHVIPENDARGEFNLAC